MGRDGYLAIFPEPKEAYCCLLSLWNSGGTSIRPHLSARVFPKLSNFVGIHSLKSFMVQIRRKLLLSTIYLL